MRRLIALFPCCCLLIGGICGQAGETAEVKVKKFAEVARATKTLAADIDLICRTSEGLRRNTGTVRLMKPNYALIRLQGDYPLQILASNGRNVFTVPDSTKYTQRDDDARGANIDSPWFGLPFRYFFTQSLNPFGPDPDPTARISYSGEESIEGKLFQVLEASGEKPMRYQARFYFGPDNIMQRSVAEFGTPPEQASFTAILTGIRTGNPMTIAEFRFKPPKSAKLDNGAEARMLSLGTRAPQFTLPTPQGKNLNLAKISKGSKATLVNFWFLSCPPCRKEFPLFQKLYDELKDKGLAMAAIDMGDPPLKVADYARQEHLTFQILMGGKESESGIFKEYRVVAYPATYLFDAEGRLVYKTAGADLDAIRQALEKLGVSPRK